MRIKLPCKRYRMTTFSYLALALLLNVFATVSRAATDQAVFWAIERDGKPAGYLLGTIHSEDPRVLEFSEEFLAKLRSNKVFAMEMVPDLPTLARLTAYMHYPKGQTLESVIGSERFNALVSALAVHKVPREFITAMKPWAAMMTLSTPPPETGFFMDLSLSLRASGNGLKVIGLETLEQQLSFLEEMPMAMQLSLLDQAIAESGRVGEAHDQMVDAYLENNLVHLQALSEDEFQTIGTEERDYFFEAGILNRNQRMLEALLPQLENNSVFVAVGALHLPGDGGLLNLLRQNGYELKPQDMPFVN
jgi:uncharacterized protein YbaP (TraB family)